MVGLVFYSSSLLCSQEYIDAAAMPFEAPPNTISFGCFTSNSAISSITQKEKQQLYYTSSNNRLFYKKHLTDKERGESFDLVYQPYSHIKNFRVRDAPLHHKTLCSHQKHFQDRGNADFTINAALADGFRPQRSSTAPDLNAGGPRTTYQGFHPPQTAEQIQKLKGRKVHPDNSENPLGGVGVLMETVPLSQTQFSAWKVSPPGHCHPVNAIHTVPKEHAGYHTLYHNDFGAPSKEATPAAKPRKLPRGASIAGPGGPPGLKMHHMAENQADFLNATRSFSRGFGKNAPALTWTKGKGMAETC